MALGQDFHIRIWPQNLRTVLTLILTLTVGCSRQPAVPSSAAPSPSSQPPYHELSSDAAGVSPTHALTAVVIPRGTPIVVRLQSVLSSAGSRPGEVFNAVLDEPIVIQGDTLAPRGTVITGRVLSTNPSGPSLQPGYLRLTLSSVNIAGKTFTLHTSAVFAKSVLDESSNPNTSLEPVRQSSATDSTSGVVPPTLHKSRDVKFSTGRQLVFWLVQALPVQG